MLADNQNLRLAATRSGKVVELHKSEKVEGGIESYVLDRHGFAVKVFIPS